MTPFANTTLRSAREIFLAFASAEMRRKTVALISSEKLQPYFGAAFMLWLVGVVELIQKTSGQSLDPRFWMGIAILITVYSGMKVFRLTPPWARCAASKPSAAVQQLISRIQSNGLAVYSDATENDGAGYVIVGSAGVYAMAVKERKVFGSRTIQFGERNKLVLGGRIADSRPLRQAETMAQKLGDQLGGVLRTRVSVKPLVVFLNDWRVDRTSAEADVAVMNEHELEQLFANGESILTPAEIAQVATCLGGLAPVTAG